MSVELEEENSNDNEFLMYLPDLKSAENVKDPILPVKSKDLYEKAYNEFITWCTTHNVKSYTENILLAYFSEKSKIRKASSLWVLYSMLKATLIIHHKINISKFSNVVTFLKLQSNGYTPKKSKILTKDQVLKFFNEAPDDKYLMVKVALIFGIAGACSRELTDITVDDIQDLGSSLLITIRESKTKIKRMYSIIDDGEVPIDFLTIFRKYAALRPVNTEHRRFFVYYDQGKCSRQVVGKNTFGQLPKKIAGFLQLPDSEAYTGHCFRRSSATLSSAKKVIHRGGEHFRFANDPSSTSYSCSSSNEEASAIKEKTNVVDQGIDMLIKNEPEEDGLKHTCEDSSFGFDDFEMPEADVFAEETSTSNKRRKIEHDNASRESGRTGEPRKTDEISLYGELLMTKLRKLDAAARAIVCNKIDNLLFETEMRSLNKIGGNLEEDSHVQEIPSTSTTTPIKRNLSPANSPHSASSENQHMDY